MAISTNDVSHQGAIGLSLAGGIGGAWLTFHVFAVWFLDAAAQPLLAALLFAVLTWLSVGLFIVAHDCMHGSLVPFRPAVNRAVGRIALFLYMGFSYDRLIGKHHAHHRHAGTELDPDFDAEHPSNGVLWYWTFMRRYLDWHVFWVTGALVIGYVAALATFGGVERAMHILMWAGPSLAASMQLFYFGTYLPHRLEEDDTFDDRHRSRSNDFSVPMSLLTCFHFGYHHEHHDSPNVPWWRLPAERRDVLVGADTSIRASL